MANLTMSRALAAMPVVLRGRTERPARQPATQHVLVAMQRPGYGQPRSQQRRDSQRCAPRSACGPTGFNAGPASFRANINGRDMSMEDLAKEAERFWFGGQQQRPYQRGPFSRPDSAAQRDASAERQLPVDVIEEEDAFVFTADTPGVARSDVKVQAKKEERELTISGSRASPYGTAEQTVDKQQQQQQQGGGRRRIERRFGSFSRTFKLPDNADISRISARFDNGVLSVTVKKSQPTPVDVQDIPIGF